MKNLYKFLKKNFTHDKDNMAAKVSVNELVKTHSLILKEDLDEYACIWLVLF